MNKKELLIKEIEQVPEPFLDEVLDFVRFLKTKVIKEQMNIAIASESSLKKDWLKPLVHFSLNCFLSPASFTTSAATIIWSSDAAI